MSWLNPYKSILGVFCKLLPGREVCRRQLEQNCAVEDGGVGYYLVRLPQKVWRRIVSDGDGECMGAHFLSAENHSEHYLMMGVKILSIIAISLGLMYAIFKVAIQRRAVDN